MTMASRSNSLKWTATMAARYIRPESLGQAIDAVGQGAQPIAGGTILAPKLATLNAGEISSLVDVGRLPELMSLQSVDGSLRIGASVTLAQIALSPAWSQRNSALKLAAGMVGNPLVRNSGTIGGNICSSAQEADLKPALLVMDAFVFCKSPGMEHRRPIAEVLQGSHSNELVVELHIPLVPDRRSSFVKYGWRRATSRSIVNLAASVRLDGSRMVEARLSVGGVACMPHRLLTTEELLCHAYPSTGWLQEAVRQAQQESTFEPTSIAPESYFKKLAGEGCRTLLTELTA
jgi:CO/xanthine dehydrogenase FAD-binding subunit